MKIKHSAYAGIVLLVLMAPLLGLALVGRLLGGMGDLIPVLGSADFAFTIVAFVLNVLFSYGFVLVGRAVQNRLVWMSALLGIVVAAFDMLLQFLSSASGETVLSAALFTFVYGVIGIFFGVGLVQLKGQFGSLASVAGGLNIARGVFEVLAIVSIGYFITFPLILLEIVLLFRASKLLDR